MAMHLTLSTNRRNDHRRRSACAAHGIGGTGARRDFAIETDVDLAKSRCALAGAADDDGERGKSWIGAQKITGNCSRRAFERPSGRRSMKPLLQPPARIFLDVSPWPSARQPGGPKTTPTASRTERAANTSRRMASHSWKAMRIGLKVSIFLTMP